uniref:Lysine-specific demethylase 5B n=1 Tax=Aegilops tauschii TaxID=37682 RepID=N1R3J7_AEGTA
MSAKPPVLASQPATQTTSESGYERNVHVYAMELDLVHKSFNQVSLHQIVLLYWLYVQPFLTLSSVELIFSFDPRRVSVADGAHLIELATPHFEGLQLNNTTPFDGNHFMPAFSLPRCFSTRQQFPPVDQNFIADGNIDQRSNHTRGRRRDFPQKSAFRKFSEKHEFGSSSTFTEPSFFTKAKTPSPAEERNPPKPPKFLAENCNRQQHHHSVGLPVQYQDFFITNLGEIDKHASYHNCHQIWPVGFTSYWHDRVTGSLFECEVCDGGSFAPLFKVRRLPCSVFPLPEASTILSQNGARKAAETKESSSFIRDTANDMDDDIYMMVDTPSETSQDFLSIFTSDTEDQRTSSCRNDVQSSNMMSQILPSNSENVPPGKEANINDQIGEFTFEGTSPSSVWGMISSAMVEACEKMYKEHGHLVFSCTHSSENYLLNKGRGCQNFDGPYAPLTRFCSSNGPSIPRVTEKKNDVESTYTLLKNWLCHDRIGLDLEFVQEIVESLPRSRSCINYQFLCNRAEFRSSVTVASGLLLSVHKDGQSNVDTPYGRHGGVAGLHDPAQPSGSSIRKLPPGRPISHKLQLESAADVFQIWEFLGRFAEIIDLKEVPSYEQLEDELADPWPICASQKETLSKGIQECRDYSSPMNSPANASTSHSNSESGLSNNEEIVSIFIPVETSSMKEARLDKLAAQTLGRCTGTILPGVHLALIKVLFGEVLSKLSIDPKESKPRRGRKDTESLISTKDFNFDMLTANKLTWPELARRYMLAISSINGCMDVSDISSRERVKLFRCLHGDGGILCGAVPGVAGMEKDALGKTTGNAITLYLYVFRSDNKKRNFVVNIICGDKILDFAYLAGDILTTLIPCPALLLEAENLICSSLSSEGNKVYMMDYKYSAEVPIADNRTLPDWAEALEPVRKLPTNVGTRIRNCVYEALDRKPPEWARKILEHSISKEVYKANASGRTKVLDLVQRFDSYLSNENTGSEIHEELHDIVTAATKLPKAPWEVGICKVCGIDRDDHIVLLCDGCDAEYHTYCLRPPLTRIPRGNWFCPSCKLKPERSHLDQGAQDFKRQRKGAESHAFHGKPSCMLAQNKSHLDQATQDLKPQRKGPYHDMLIKLAATVAQKEYWELSTQERIDMLKFLCDEMLNTVLIREHIEKCPDKFNDLQKKFYALNYELKDLKDKEEMRTSYGEMDTLSDQISKVQESIGTVESELNMACLRRDFLGKDSLGRLYWVLGRSGKRPLLVADGSMLISNERDPPSTSDCKGWNSASVVVYELDEEIHSLVDWLREYDPREKELKRAIQQWQWQRQRQRHLHHQLGNFVLSDPPVSSKGSSNSSEQQLMELPSTKAAAILGKTCRCDCLEPIWPAQHHCTACHETYFTSTEYEDHAGKCNGHVNKDKDSSVDPSSTTESTKLKSCPYDFEQISRKFVTNDSNKEIVKDIGLIGSNGVPSFVPSRAAFIDPPVILNKNKKQDDIRNDDCISSSLEECQAMSAQNLGQEGSNSAQDCPAASTSCDENVSKSKEPAPDTDTTSCEEAASSATDKPTRLLAVNGGLVPESSLRPVTGRNSHILKQQKINLLDIEAALPEEAFRASKSQQMRRRSWRSFVKRAESISEMVLATSMLERVIKSEFLKNDWWYWSSFTVAIKTSTVSSLALRIYTLDDCIMYTKEPSTVPPADKRFFLGIRVTRTAGCFFLSQQQYAEDLLDRAGIDTCKSSPTPIDSNGKLQRADGPRVDDSSAYRSLAEALRARFFFKLTTCFIHLSI